MGTGSAGRGACTHFCFRLLVKAHCPHRRDSRGRKASSRLRARPEYVAAIFAGPTASPASSLASAARPRLTAVHHLAEQRSSIPPSATYHATPLARASRILGCDRV